MCAMCKSKVKLGDQRHRNDDELKNENENEMIKRSHFVAIATRLNSIIPSNSSIYRMTLKTRRHTKQGEKVVKIYGRCP